MALTDLKGVEEGMEGSALVLAQERGTRLQLDENGSFMINLPLNCDVPRQQLNIGNFALIEEVVVRQLTSAIAFADWIFERSIPPIA